MILPASYPFKNILHLCLIMLFSLIAAYLAFISFFSVLIGIGYVHQSGFWVPITAGIFLFVSVSWFLLRTLTSILGHITNIKEKNILKIQQALLLLYPLI